MLGFVEHSRLAFDANPPAPEDERVVLGAVLVTAGLAPAESGLNAHWKLNESTGGIAYDSSGSYMYCVAPASRALEGGES